MSEELIKADQLQKQNDNVTIEPYTKYPNWFYELGLDPTELLVLINVYSYSKNDKPFVESPKSLANRLHVAPNTIRKKLDLLVDRNILIKSAGAKGKTNIYKVNFEYIGSIPKSGIPNLGIPKIGKEGYQDLVRGIPKFGNNNNKYNNKDNNIIFLLEKAKELLDFYANNIAVDISSSAKQILCNCVELYKKEDILEAMKLTIEKQDTLKDIAFMNYMRRILQNWNDYGKGTKKTFISSKNKTISIQKGESSNERNSKEVDKFGSEIPDYSKFD